MVRGNKPLRLPLPPFRKMQITIPTRVSGDNLNELAKEVQDVKPGEEKQISPAKKRTLNGKLGNVVRVFILVIVFIPSEQYFF